MITATKLDEVLQDIAKDHPTGLRAADFVSKVLHSGQFQGKGPVSTAVHASLLRLCEEGVLVRSDNEDNRTRAYRLHA